MGALGVGMSGQTSSPYAVGVTNATRIACGEINSMGGNACALEKDGSLWCWGAVFTGTTPESKPEPVKVLDHIVDIKTGADRACALSEDGTLRCWGANHRGQLGDGTRQASASPIRLPGLGPVYDFSIQGFGGCAIGTDGEVRCWGYDSIDRLCAVRTDERVHCIEREGLGDRVFGFPMSTETSPEGKRWRDLLLAATTKKMTRDASFKKFAADTPDRQFLSGFHAGWDEQTEKLRIGFYASLTETRTHQGPNPDPLAESFGCHSGHPRADCAPRPIPRTITMSLVHKSEYAVRATFSKTGTLVKREEFPIDTQ